MCYFEGTQIHICCYDSFDFCVYNMDVGKRKGGGGGIIILVGKPILSFWGGCDHSDTQAVQKHTFFVLSLLIDPNNTFQNTP